MTNVSYDYRSCEEPTTGSFGSIAAAFLLLAPLLAPAPTVAQDAPADAAGAEASERAEDSPNSGSADSGPASDDRPADDRPADDRPAAARETSIHGGWLVIAAYLLLWVGLLAYILYLGSRQRRLSTQIDRLEREIDETLAGVEEE